MFDVWLWRRPGRRRRGRRRRRRTASELVESGFHFLKDGTINFLERVVKIFEWLFSLRIILLKLWFIIVLEVHVHMVNSKGPGLTHGVNVLSKDMLRHGRVDRGDVGDC